VEGAGKAHKSVENWENLLCLPHQLFGKKTSKFFREKKICNRKSRSKLLLG
jgi:hypothetical protein